MGKNTITFVIDNDNGITAFGSREEAKSAGGEGSVFSTPQQLDQATADCPAARLVEIWNGIPGVEPTKKFTSRAVGLARIWKAIQGLAPAEAATPAQPARTAASSRPRSTRKASAPRKERRAPDAAPRDTKKLQVLAMMREPGGASLDAIMKATGWQAHTIRGFMATVPKKLGLTVISEEVEGNRVYSLKGKAASGD